MKFKLKKVVHEDGEAQYELRNGTMLVIVALDGYQHKGCYSRKKDRWGWSTSGTNIHVSTNDAVQMTFDDFEELTWLIDECRTALEKQHESVQIRKYMK